MENNSEIKLSPAASLAVVILLIIGAGGVYVVKPELFNKYLGQVTSGTVDNLPKDSYYPQIESNLKTMLKGQLITRLASTGGSQAQFNAVNDIQIESISASPIGYFKNERAFWAESNLRTVKLNITFNAGGKRYQATGDFTVSGAADRISLGSVQLQ